MISGRTLVLLAAAAGGYWLWQSGQWRAVVAKIPPLAQMAGNESATAPATGDIRVTPPDAPPAPLQIRTWTDEHGVVHFEQATSAPRDAATYTPRSGGTMADYERELEAREGISIEDIARAKAAREAAAQEAAKQDAAAQDHAQATGKMDLATQQARELMRRHEQALEKIRTENNK